VPPQVNRASDEATQRVASSWNTRGPIEGSRVNKARDDATQRVASSWNTWGPIEGSQHPQASYLSPGQEVSFTFLCVGWYLAIQVLPIRITQERHLKLPGLDLIGGGGGICHCLVLWRGTYSCCLSPADGDPSPTQILTQHSGAQSHTDSPLTNSGTAPTRQVPIVQDLWVIETLADGVSVLAVPPFNNPDGTMGLH
jgi:hypothetical protein